MAQYTQILVYGLDFRYEPNQKALKDLLVKASGIECELLVQPLSDASALVHFADTRTASGSELVQFVLQQQLFLFNYPLHLQPYASHQVTSASPPQANEDKTRAPSKPAVGRGRGGKRNQLSAASEKDSEVSRPGNVPSLRKETESLPFADSPPYHQPPPHHASPAPTHSFSSIRPESRGENFADGTASRSNSNWPPQPGGPGPSQPGPSNPNWPRPEWPPGQPLPPGPGWPYPGSPYPPERPPGDPRPSPPGGPPHPGGHRYPLPGGPWPDQPFPSGPGPHLSPSGPSAVWPGVARPVYSPPEDSLHPQSSYSPQHEIPQKQQPKLQEHSFTKDDSFVSETETSDEPRENCIIVSGLPEDAVREKVADVVRKAVSKSSKVNVIDLKKQDDGCVATVHISDRKGLTTLWKKRHKRSSISYGSTPLKFDLLWPEEYEENRFLVENIPSNATAETLVLHLKAQDVIEDSKVTPKFLGGGDKAVVFLNDNIVDDEMIENLNRDAADFEGSEEELRFSRILVSRSVRLSGLSKGVDKGTLRNYLFSLSTSPPVPLVEAVEVSEDLHCNSAIVTLRTIAEREALLKLTTWPVLSSCQPKVEPYSQYPASVIDTDSDANSASGAATADAPIPLVEPELDEPFELILQAPDDIDEDIIDYIYADKRRERTFQRKFTLGELQWDSDTKTLTVTCRQLSSSESDFTKEAKDEVAAFCDDYDKKFLYVSDSSLWDRALDYASKENSIRGNSCRINGNRDESRIWFIGESVSDLHSQCANVIGEWLREKKKREEVIEESIPCHSKSRMRLLKSCKQYHALGEKVTLNDRPDLQKIDIKGQTYEVHSAKETIVSLLGDIDEKIVTVENRLWTFFQGPGFQQLVAAIDERQLRAVPVSVEEDHPGVRIAAFRDDLSEARLLVKSQFTSQKIDPEDDEQRTYLQTSQAAIAFEGVCSKLLLRMEGFGSPSEEFWVTGRADNVKKACNEVLRSLKGSVIYTKSVPLLGRSHIDYLLKFSNIEIEGIVASLQQYKAKISFEKNPPSILLKATQDGFDSLQRRVEALVDRLCTETEELKKHGLEKYVSSREFKHEKTEIQDQHSVIISLGDEDEYDDDEAVDTSGYADDDSSSTSLGVFNSTKDSSRVIRLFAGDLCSHEVDAIVNAANEDLDHGGGLAHVIVQRAGYQVQAESKQVLAKRRNGRLKPGEAVFTSAGSLTTTRFVIHAVGPRWHGSKKSKAAECLREAVTSALKEADKLNLVSVAFPAIGAGMFGCPSDFVAENMVLAVDKFFSKNSKSTVKRVDFVMRDQDTKNIRSFSDELGRKLKMATSPMKRSRSPRPQRMQSGSRDRSLPSSNFSSGRNSNVDIVVNGGDITQEEADAIVNSTDANLDMQAAQASKAIARVAGPGLQEECTAKRKSGPLKPGGVCVTLGFSLPAKNVFHIICPQSPQDLEKIVYDCVQKAASLNLSSIAFPALGTGNLGIPDKQAAAALFAGFSRFCDTAGSSSSVKTIKVVVYDSSKLAVFRNASANPSSSPQMTQAHVSSSGGPPAPPVPSNEATLANNCLVRVEKGSVTSDSSAAIVATQGIVLQTVLNADAKAKSDWTSKYPKGWTSNDEVCELSTSQLQSKIVYAVAPSSSSSDKKDAQNSQVLTDLVIKCLMAADSAKHTSIAIPALGTGNLGYSNAVCAGGILEAAKSFASKVSNPSLKLIKIVVFDAHRVSDFEKELQSRIPSSAASASGAGLMSRLFVGVKSAVSSLMPSSLTTTTSMASTEAFIKTRKEVKSVSASEPDSIRVAVVGKSKSDCRAALGELKSAVDYNCVRRSYQGKIPTAFDEGKLKDISNRFGVALAIDVPMSDGGESSPVIHVAGKRAEVSEALIEIGRIFTETMERELDEVAAEGVITKVSWKWQSDGGSWKPYLKFANLEIEKVYQAVALKKAKSKFSITINKSKYEIDLQAMTQTSLSNSKQRKIIREDVEAAGVVVEFPPTWSSTDVDRGDASVVLLQSSSQEYKDISQNFVDTLLGESGTIQKIERIENPILYRQYSLAKDLLANKRANEITAGTAKLEFELFHGTGEDTVQHIIDNGFNRIYAGTSVGKLYGAGVYFAKESGVSHSYATPNAQNERRMFVCNVLLGLYTVGNKTMLEPPVINPGKSKTDRFDSTVNDSKNPRIFASCFRDNMAYPAYLITFV